MKRIFVSQEGKESEFSQMFEEPNIVQDIQRAIKNNMLN